MTPEELHQRRDKEQAKRSTEDDHLLCCTAAGCLSCGSEEVLQSLRDTVKATEANVRVSGTGCLGLCSKGPLVKRESDGAFFGGLSPETATALVPGRADLVDRQTLADHRIEPTAPFFALQQRIVLENAGRTDPERVEDYIFADGYEALSKAVSEMTPEEVVSEVKKSGLRGRGGAGYPTALKWELVAKQADATKYIVCNADEGDPGAFMDRSVLEGDPHRVLEGMALAGYAVGASQGYIYVRGEYALAVQRLEKAIRQAERERILGNRVLDSAFAFHVDIRVGAGAFVCGEETALLASIEGKRGEPRTRPPYPPERGLFGKPTLINNVETFANIAPIVRNGGDWFASIGTERSKGTKVFAVAGKIVHTGLVEVPMGTSLRTIVQDICGGVPGGGKLKAVLTGGPSGGAIPEALLDLPVDYESLSKAGSMMGSGGLIVMDDETSMVDVARYFMEFCMDESCGKCIPCRAGTVQMHDILSRISRREAAPSDLEMLGKLATLLKETSLCGLGQTAPNPVVSALRYFREEFDEKLIDSAGITDRARPSTRAGSGSGGSGSAGSSSGSGSGSGLESRE
ncbi:MAG: NADH-quinone oxidoreductase subunit NuoF [Deltaproteobacteria bacterium]|nr:NADH-quinone oxidoreductase subunit NuoF [Deltaproteobacteria bacterium]